MRVTRLGQRLAVREQHARLVAECAVGRARLLGEHGDLQERVTRAARQLVAPGARQRIPSERSGVNAAMASAKAPAAARWCASRKRSARVRSAWPFSTAEPSSAATDLRARRGRGRRPLQPRRRESQGSTAAASPSSASPSATCRGSGESASARPAMTRSATSTAGLTAPAARASRFSARSFGRKPSGPLSRLRLQRRTRRALSCGCMATKRRWCGSARAELQLVGVDGHQRFARPDLERGGRFVGPFCARRWHRQRRLQQRRRVLDATTGGLQRDERLQRRPCLRERGRQIDGAPVEIDGDVGLPERSCPDRPAAISAPTFDPVSACVSVSAPAVKASANARGSRRTRASASSRARRSARAGRQACTRGVCRISTAASGRAGSKIASAQASAKSTASSSRSATARNARAIPSATSRRIEGQRQLEPLGRHQRVRGVEASGLVERLERRLGRQQLPAQQPGPLAQERDGQARVHIRQSPGEIAASARAAVVAGTSARASSSSSTSSAPTGDPASSRPSSSSSTASARSAPSRGSARRQASPSSMTSAPRAAGVSARRASPASASARSAGSCSRAPASNSDSSAPG